MRAVTVGFARIRHGGLHKKVYADHLITGGLFGMVRNPLYLGKILIAFGLFVLHNNPWVYLIGTALVLLAYQSIAVTEETFLLSKFGNAYEDYCRYVARWMPRLRLLPAAMDGMRFSWRWIMIKDYGVLQCCSAAVLQCWMVMAAALWLNEVYAQGGASAAEARLLAAFVMVVGVFGLASGLRFLKKSRWVVDDQD